jgi:hypothetical protein
MGRGALAVLVAVGLGVVTPALVEARAPHRPVPAAPEESATPPAEAASADPAEPEVDPATVGEAAEDEPVRYDEETTTAPSGANRVLQNRRVQTVVSLFGRGVTVNDREAEPPTTPVRVRVRPKGAGASLNFLVTF